MKKVLIITYYWVPSGGAGVQRWLKFTKYFRDFGWEPIVYCPENPEYPSIDKSFEKDIPENLTVLKTPIWEPYDVYRSLLGKKGQPINAGFISEGKKSGWKDKLAIWIRGNFLIPDPRKFWVKPSVKFLSNYISENKVDAVISTGPPHSMHLIALGLKKKFPDLTWVADFRDPWTNIDFYEELHLTKMADAVHHKKEREVVQTADCLVTVSDGWMQGFLKLKPKHTQVITNGFDDTDIAQSGVEPDKKFSIAHIGTLNAARNPATLWKVLGELCRENEDFKSDLEIKLVGKVDFSVMEAIREAGLDSQLNKIDYLPHAEAIRQQQSSQLLLLLINNTPNASGILTGKFYEYMASKRPILAIGPTNGDAAITLQNASAGKMVDFDDKESTRETIENFYTLYKAKSLTINSDSVNQYSRRNLTKEYALLLDKLSK